MVTLIIIIAVDTSGPLLYTALNDDDNLYRIGLLAIGKGRHLLTTHAHFDNRIQR